MSIVRMQKLAAVGIDTSKKELMNQLMDLEAVQFIDQSDKFEDSFWAQNVSLDESQELVGIYESHISRASQALEVIEKYGGLKSPLFSTRRIISENAFRESVASSDSAVKAIDELILLNEKIKNVQDTINKCDSDIMMLTPWLPLDTELDKTETVRTKTVFGIIPSLSQIDEIDSRLAEYVASSILHVVNEDDDYKYIVFTTMKEDIDVILSNIKDTGFTQLFFDSYKGTASEVIKSIESEKSGLISELDGLISEIKNLASHKDAIENYSDSQTIELEKEKVRSKILKTKKTFFIEGWVPVELKEKVIDILDQNGCIYEFTDPSEGEEVPVLLKNKSFFKPIEAITEMYSLPMYGSFDPTTIYALWYICFFGMMFSDACYGLIMVIFCAWALKKFNLEGTTYKMVKGFLYCGISTIFWGVMFGGYFGDFFEVFASSILNKTVDIKPLWFDPLENPLKLLIFSLILGVTHIFIGMGISVYMKIRDKDIIGAIFGECAWYVALIGCISWVAFAYFGSPYAEISKWISIVGAIMVFIGGGLDKKGFGKIFGGVINLYNVTGYMSDILSYSRILALGLATSVIAQVVNMMGSLAGGGIVGAIVLIVVFLVGQVINFAINVLGSFVHASRLQYIEFFGKFYVDGGEAFDPLRKKTKYVKIDK